MSSLSLPLSLDENGAILDFEVHPDIEDLLWIANGPRENFTNPPPNYTMRFNLGPTITFGADNGEPSLIHTHFPVSASLKDKISPPGYFPCYARLTPDQRATYWAFLKEPYNSSFDIGYVFIFYYGLERHLIHGNHRKAFEVLLKLKKAHSNPSFQNYSSCAMLFSCGYRNDPGSLDIFSSYCFPDQLSYHETNVLLTSRLACKSFVSPEDILISARSFGNDKRYYLEKYPAVFLKHASYYLSVNSTFLNNFTAQLIEYAQSENAKIDKHRLGANLSIFEHTMGVHRFTGHRPISGMILDMLAAVQANVKEEVSALRKERAADRAT